MQIQLKPGITTSEFWSATLGALILFALTLLDLLDGGYAAVGVTILAALYQAQRADLKRIQAKAEAEVVKPKVFDFQGKPVTGFELPPGAAQ